MSSVIIEGKYKIIDKLGKGSFGSIFSGINKNTGEKIAVKISRKDSNILLKNEARIYNYLMNTTCIPSIRSFGNSGEYSYLILDLLGDSLENYKKKCGGKLTLNMVLMIGIKMIDIIEIIHDKGILHRDINPGNFLMGRNNNESKLFLIDFGLSKKYIDIQKNHIKMEQGKKLLGTPEFVSINIHSGITPSRRDDLESIGYVLIYLLRGCLPWKDIEFDDIDNNELYDNIKKIKVLNNIWLLFDEIPGEFIVFIKYCRSLEFTQKPNYNYLKLLLKNLYNLHEFTPLMT